MTVCAHEHGIPDELRRGDPTEGIDHDRELQADEHEEERVQEVLDDLPHRDPLQAHLRGRQLGCVPAEVDPGRDGGEHGRDAHQLRRNERYVPRQE